jgi:uncharacterized membrane protein YfcA
METQIIIFVQLSFLFAAFLKGITGMGFSTICLAVLSLYLEPRVTIPVIILPSISSNVFVMIQVGRFREALLRFWYVYLFALPGLYLGVQLLYFSDSSVSRVALGITLMLYGFWSLMVRTVLLPSRLERPLAVPVGFCTGIINGLTGSQILPLLPYMISLRLERDLFIQAVNISFTLCSLVMLLLLSWLEIMESGLFMVSAVGIVGVALGICAGGWVRTLLPEARYQQAVLVFLLLIGLSLVVRP